MTNQSANHIKNHMSNRYSYIFILLTISIMCLVGMAVMAFSDQQNNMDSTFVSVGFILAAGWISTLGAALKLINQRRR